MSYIATTAVLIHDDDKQNFSIHQGPGNLADVTLQINSGTNVLSVVMSRSIAWEILAQLSDHLEETNGCPICVMHGTHKVTWQHGNLSSSAHIELVDE